MLFLPIFENKMSSLFLSITCGISNSYSRFRSNGEASVLVSQLFVIIAFLNFIIDKVLNFTVGKKIRVITYRELFFIMRQTSPSGRQKKNLA